MLIKKWIMEIREVGFRDWFWFVFYLKRNVFSTKLCITRYNKPSDFGDIEVDIARLSYDRERAHTIDHQLYKLTGN